MKFLFIFLFFPFFLFCQVQIGNDIDGETEGDLFGQDTALSGDGTILAVASPNSDENGLGTGLVQVFENSNGTWSQIGQNLYGQVEGSAQVTGISVDLSSDGTILAFGAALNAVGNLSDAGEVKIYENINGTWTQIGQTIEGEFASSLFGYDVALSSNGNIIGIGGVGEGSPGSITGLVKVFENNNGTWSQVGQTLSGSQDNEFFGDSIAISSDGNTILIGAPGFDGFDGRIKVFENNNGTWTQVGGDILASDIATNQEFGSSVSMASDGNTIAASTRSIGSGYVRVFENINGDWIELGGLIQGETITDYFGYSIALSDDSNILAVGAVTNDDNGLNSGHTRIYENTGGTWTQLGTDIEGEAAGDNSGESVSLSSNGDTVAIGAVANADAGTSAGHVRVYDLNQVLSIVDSEILSFKIYPNPAKNRFTVQLNDQSQLKHISLYNNIGQRILTTDDIVVDTSELSSGYYLVKIESNNGNKVSKNIIIK